MAETWKQWEGTSVDGKFRLDQFLGGSDHSAVFLTQLPGGGKAAIKFVEVNPQTLAFQRANWEQSRRFNHPHLIRILGTGQCRLGNLDLLYVVMEYAEENLAQILPERALSGDETRDLLGSVIETLQALHEKGLAHGSLKPSNVMAVQDQLKLSGDQVHAFGKPALATEKAPYAAPECASEGFAAPSDVWSLGVMLIEVLTRRVPERDATGQPVIPANLPVPFQEIAAHCLTVTPQDRWNLSRIAERLGTTPQAVAGEQTAEIQKVMDQPVPVRAAIPETAARHAAAGEFGSPRRLMVSGITFLLVLVGIYAGSQLVRRASQEAAGVSAGSSAATETAKPSTRGADSSTAASTAHSDASRAKAAAPTKESAPDPAISTAVSSPARVLVRVEPNVSASARATITGKIRVRVDLNVDAAGKVTDAHLTSPGPSQYFASRALEAARRWTFTPAQVNGQSAPSKWTLRFAFSRRTTDVDAQVTSN